METQNLWPDFTTEDSKGPKAILKEQAMYLVEKTNKVLSADVITTQYKDTIIHSFYIVAPVLSNYRYKLFSVKHGAVFYPLQIEWEGDAIPFDHDFKNENSFIGMLRSIFTDKDTVKIISSLLSQSLEEQRA